jgi:hypothetical protein
LQNDEDEYKTFLGILQNAGQIWATEQPVRPEMPFHVILVVTDHLKGKRKHWGVPRFRL